MAREKINISIDADVLVEIDNFVFREDRPSRSNAIEVLVKRGFKLPLAQESISKLYGTSEIQTFVKSYFGLSDSEAEDAISANFK